CNSKMHCSITTLSFGEYSLTNRFDSILRIEPFNVPWKIRCLADVWKVEDFHNEPARTNTCTTVRRTTITEKVNVIFERPKVHHACFEVAIQCLLLENIRTMLALCHSSYFNAFVEQVCSAGTIVIL